MPEPDLATDLAELTALAEQRGLQPSFTDNGEDVVVDRAFAGQAEGLWVDVGAGHPLWGSTTKRLSLRGWRGLNIEPQLDLLAALAADRPADVNCGVACGAASGKRPFHRVVDNWGLSTTDPELAEAHRRDGWEVVEEVVEVTTLGELWQEALDDQPVDVLKVDVEGGEGEVLAGVDLAGHRPRLVVVEATVPNSPEPAWDGWEPMVLSAGYRLTLFDGLNRFYVRDDERELAERASVPCNVFDRAAPVRWLGALRRAERELRQARAELAAARADREGR